MEYFNLKFENDKLAFINQTKLPLKEEYISTEDYERIAEAIERLEIRGAPAIGIAAGYALALAVKTNRNIFEQAFERLKKTRPTAVNLFYALNRIKTFYESSTENKNYESVLEIAKQIHREDIERCRKISCNGAGLFMRVHNYVDSKVKLLTHCNTGLFATGGEGTAFGIIAELNRCEFIEIVYACEARPLLQGLRLTSFELEKHKINYKIITDSTAAYLMQQKQVDAVILGADRIARNGDTANKIGTYMLAVNAKHHSIPFYVAAPITTIDKNISSGKQIIIEERSKLELSEIAGVKVAHEDIQVYNPAFDLTPAELITAIITDEQVYFPPYDFK